MSHYVDEDGTVKFEVKWEGFEKKSDRTFEPEENLAQVAPPNIPPQTCLLTT